MFPVGEFSHYVFRALTGVFGSPLFWVILAVVYRQNTRLERLERRFSGAVAYPAWRRTINALAYGLGGGAVTSLLLVFLGVSLSSLGISYIWLVALILLLINQRFMCFAYAGGIVGLARLLLGYPAIDIPGLMGLVAVLHLAESVLIRSNGHYAAVPVYLRTTEGRAVGGFSLQRFWPLPLVALLLLTVPDAAALGETLQLPDWWPLLRDFQSLPAGGSYVYYLFPLTAALGYGDIAITAGPREKARYSAAILGGYSLGLLVLALLSAHQPWLRWLAVLYAPLGHEWVIYLGRQRESRGRPRFVSPADGVMLLAVLPGSPAQRGGLVSGDTLLAVGEAELAGCRELAEALAEGMPELRFLVRREDGSLTSLTLPWAGGTLPALGVVPVPDGTERYYVTLGGGSIFGRWWEKMKIFVRKRS